MEETMNREGTDIWCEICDAIVDDDDKSIVDKKNSKRIEKDDGWGWEMAFLTPYKKIHKKALKHFAAEVVSLASKADREDGMPGKITVSFGPVYHFTDHEVLDRFQERVNDIIEAAFPEEE